MRKAIFRSLVVSIFFASLAGMVAAVSSLMQAQALIAKGGSVEYMEPGQEGYEIIQFNNAARSKTTNLEKFQHSFSHPQFWLFWLLSCSYIVLPVFLGCLTIVFWYRKRPGGE